MTACGVCAGEGFVEHHEQRGALVPCKRCRTKAFDKWSQGKFQSPLDRMDAIEAARRPTEPAPDSIEVA